MCQLKKLNCHMRDIRRLKIYCGVINMALWQVAFILLPKGNLENNKSLAKIDTKTLWEGYTIDKNSIADLEKVLRRTKSWSEDIIQLGRIDSNVIEIFYEGTEIGEVNCRLDLKDLSNIIFETIIRFIRTNDLSIIANEKIYYTPEKKSILEIIKQSDAYKFVKDPDKFIDEIRSQ